MKLKIVRVNPDLSQAFVQALQIGIGPQGIGDDVLGCRLCQDRIQVLLRMVRVNIAVGNVFDDLFFADALLQISLGEQHRIRYEPAEFFYEIDVIVTPPDTVQEKVCIRFANHFTPEKSMYLLGR